MKLSNFKKIALLIYIPFIYGLPSGIVAQGVWTQKASLPDTARYDAMSFSIISKGYSIGGFDGGTSVLKSVWMYDAIGNNWQKKQNFPTSRWMGVSFSIGLMGYICTGAPGHFNDCWEYNSTNDIWTQKASLPGPGRYAAFGFAIDSIGFVGGGEGNSGRLMDFWEFDPISNIWTPKSNLPTGKRSFAFGFSLGAKGYFGTGIDSTGILLDDFWEYNPGLDSWIQKANFPGGKRKDIDGGNFVIGSCAFVGSGWHQPSNTYYNDFWKYSQANDTWSPITSLSGSVRMGASGFSIGGKGYIGLGVIINSTSFNDLWEYDTTSVGVSEIKDDFDITLFPNPSTGCFTIQTNNTTKVTSIEIFNVMGEKIQVGNGQWAVGKNSQIQIDISKEPEGVYFVRLHYVSADAMRVKTRIGTENKKIIIN